MISNGMKECTVIDSLYAVLYNEWQYQWLFVLSFWMGVEVGISVITARCHLQM